MAGIGGHSQRHRRLRGRIVFALLFILAILIFFASQANDDILDQTKTNTESAAAPVLTYLTMPVRGFENFVTDFKRRAQVNQENLRLRNELSRLSDVETRANAAEIKLAQLEKILNVDVNSGAPERKIAARAVAETNGPFVRSTLLNTGTSKGVKKGYAVMTVDGLLGHVIRVGKSSARVLRLEDLNSRIAVMSSRSQSRAILTGDNSRNPLLSFITEGSDWTDGDIVITSGDDGVLPQGLPIGFVEESENGDFRVRLYVNDHHVDWVWVYPFDPVTLPEDSETEAVEAPEGESGGQSVPALAQESRPRP